MATTLSRMTKKAASSIFPLVDRTTHKSYTSAILSTPLKTSTTISTTNLFRANHGFSSLADKRSNADGTFLNAIESAIKGAEKKIHEFAETPKEFPFKIKEDAKSWRCITLTREYQGEEIEVEVGKYYFGVSLDGSVSNKNGHTLKFGAEVANGIKINHLDVESPNDSDDDDDISYSDKRFSNLDKKLKKDFRTYFEVRGIEPSNTKFLCDYMVQREHKSYTDWLNNLRKFVAN